MLISPINTNQQAYKPNFQSNTRVCRNKYGELLYRNITNFFRNDLDWEKFGDFLINKYKDTDKVNIYCYGCSDGSEPLSIAMLIRELFQNSNKFFPIIAKDIDKRMIYLARKGEIEVDCTDFDMINKFTNNKFDNYIKTSKSLLGFNPIPAKINPELLKDIEFSVADIKEDLHTVKPQNSIVFCRNLWPYIKPETERIKLVNNLFSVLKDNSTVVIGNFDKWANLNNLLLSRDFKRAKYLPNVYETTFKTIRLDGYANPTKIGL